MIFEQKWKNYKKNGMHRYSVNLRSVIGNHLSGLGYHDAKNLSKFLDMTYMSYKAYKKCETCLGDKLLRVMIIQLGEEALKEEITITKERCTMDTYGQKPALTVSLDMG